MTPPGERLSGAGVAYDGHGECCDEDEIGNGQLVPQVLRQETCNQSTRRQSAHVADRRNDLRPTRWRIFDSDVYVSENSRRGRQGRTKCETSEKPGDQESGSDFHTQNNTAARRATDRAGISTVRRPYQSEMCPTNKRLTNCPA